MSYFLAGPDFAFLVPNQAEARAALVRVAALLPEMASALASFDNRDDWGPLEMSPGLSWSFYFPSDDVRISAWAVPPLR